MMNHNETIEKLWLSSFKILNINYNPMICDAQKYGLTLIILDNNYK